MPGPPSATPPYVTGERVLQLSRARCQDAGITIDGNLLSDAQPYTLTLLNSAIEDVQNKLADNGVETFPNELVIPSIPISGSMDPATQCWISYENFFDGVNSFPTPVLPQDMLIPTRMWERSSGSQSVMIPMYPTNDGLPSRPKTSWLREWEWRDDRIMLVGATQLNDVRLRYSRIIPDVADFTTTIPLIRCTSVLAWHIAIEFSASRGGTQLEIFEKKYEEAMESVILRTTRKTQRNNNRRIPYGGQQSSFPNWGWTF